MSVFLSPIPAWAAVAPAWYWTKIVVHHLLRFKGLTLRVLAAAAAGPG
jgi:hypothetical protein